MPDSNVVPVPAGHVYDGRHGEVIDLAAAPSDRLAQFLAEVRDLEASLRQAKAQVGRELHRRMDAEASWTLNLPGYKVTGQSPDRVDYDPEELAGALRGLRRSGLISPRASKAALERVVELRPRKKGLAALLRLGGEVAAAVRACERPVESERRVSVSPLAPESRVTVAELPPGTRREGSAPSSAESSRRGA